MQGSGAAYHGDWGLDFTTVDPHLGTEADFAAFVACAHKLGLKVYLDVDVNHTANVIVPTGGTAWVGPGDKPYRDCDGRIFDPNVYVFGLRFPCLKATNMPRPPSVVPADKDVKKPEWLNDVRRYHNRGDVAVACSELCVEQGDLGGLDDLFTEQPTVARGLGDIHSAWIKKYKVDGFHVRDATHLNSDFFAIWSNTTSQARGVTSNKVIVTMLTVQSNLLGWLNIRARDCAERAGLRHPIRSARGCRIDFRKPSRRLAFVCAYCTREDHSTKRQDG